MKARNLKKAFVAVFMLSTALPILGLLGLRGPARIAGFEQGARHVGLTFANVMNRSWMQSAEAYFERHAFGRGELLMLKNAAFEAANLGQFHSGYSGQIVQGRDGVLFEKPYIDVKYAPKTAYCEGEHAEQFAKAAAQFGGELAKRGIAFGLVIAPSKADIYEDKIPERFKIFSVAPEGFSIRKARAASLRDRASIPFVDATELLTGIQDRDLVFPYSGTHWTQYAAAVAAAELVDRIALQTGADLRKPAPSADIARVPRPRTSYDRDLAHLLNLPWRYHLPGNRYIDTRFLAPAAATGSSRGAGRPISSGDSGAVGSANASQASRTLREAHSAASADAPAPRPAAVVFGDSFGQQVSDALSLSGAYPDTRLIFNRRPAREELDAALADAGLFIVVYSAHSLARNRATSELYYLARLLEQ